MNHMDALRLSASEKFLLDELPADLREQFEEHFFECTECATDVRAGAAMVQQVKRELRDPSGGQLRLEPKQATALSFLLRPALTLGALAATLLFVVYQNVVTYPQLRREVASANAPAILPVVSLVGGMSRGDKVPSAVTDGRTPVLLSVDIPTEERFSSYTLALYTPEGKQAWQIAVSPEQARNTLTLTVSPANIRTGSYVMLVQGVSHAGELPVDIVRYHFSITIRN